MTTHVAQPDPAADAAVGSATLAELLEGAAAEYAQRPAIAGPDGCTYAQLHAAAVGVAAGLTARGLRPGDRVGVCVRPSAGALRLLAALAVAGLPAVLLDPATPSRRRDDAFRGVEVRLVVTDVHDAADDAGHDAGQGIAAATLAEVLAGTGTVAAAGPGPATEAYLIHTSGSTGTPKAVAVAHAAAAAHARHAAAWFGIGPDDVVLQFASLGFDVAQEEIWPTWAVGAAVAPRPAELPDPHRLAELVHREGITVLQLPTAYWRTLSAEPAVAGPTVAGPTVAEPTVAEPTGTADPRLAGVRLVVVGGEAANVADLVAHRRGPLGGAALVNGYGPTEAVVTATARRWDVDEPAPGAPGGLPIGRAFPGHVVTVVRGDGRVAGVGDEGELYLSGLLADGYVGQPERTAERFVTGVPGLPADERAYRTGDLVRVLDGGELLFLRRVDDQVKLRGHRIELGETEAVLRTHPAVRDAACALAPRPGREPVLVAAVVPTDAQDGPDPATLSAYAAARLPAPFVPTRWGRVDAVPLTASGKVDRAAVVAAVGDPVAAPHTRPVDAAASTGTPGPSAGAREALARIWCDVLGTDRVEDDSDFVGSGGDSLLAVRMVARARGAGWLLSPAAVLRGTTFAGAVAAARPDPAAAPASGATPADPSDPDRSDPVAVPAPTADEGSPVDLLPSQLRWLRDGPLPDLHHFVLAALLRVPAELSDDVLVDAAAVLVEQHGALGSLVDPDAGTVRRLRPDPRTLVDRVEVTSEDELRAAAERAQTALDPVAGRVFALTRIVLGDEHRLLAVVHHLVLDGWSMALLVDDLDAAITTAVTEGRARLDPPSASCAELSASVADYVRSDAAREHARRWLDAPWDELPTRPERRPGTGLLPTVVTRRATVAAPELTRLVAALAGTGHRLVDVVRAAIAVGVAGRTGRPVVGIDVYESHRADPVGGLDLSRTVGYVQSTHPVLLRVEGSGAAAVRALLAAADVATPPAFSFDALRFGSPLGHERAALAALPRPALRLNYRSQLDRLERRRSDGVVGDADEDTGAHRSPRQHERYELMFEGDVIDGELVLGVKFSTDDRDPADIEALIADVAGVVRLVATDGGGR